MKLAFLLVVLMVYSSEFELVVRSVVVKDIVSVEMKVD